MDAGRSTTVSGLDGSDQVLIGSQNEGVNADTLGNRGGNSSLGGERRPQGNDAESRDEF